MPSYSILGNFYWFTSPNSVDLKPLECKQLDLLKNKKIMFVSIDLCLVPIGVGTSLSPYIKECIEIIKNEGLNYELGANGTAIEGDWDKVFECVKKCHEKIHSKGAPRIYTTMKVNTRTDKEQKFSDKVRSVLEK